MRLGVIVIFTGALLLSCSSRFATDAEQEPGAEEPAVDGTDQVDQPPANTATDGGDETVGEGATTGTADTGGTGNSDGGGEDEGEPEPTSRTGKLASGEEFNLTLTDAAVAIDADTFANDTNVVLKKSAVEIPADDSIDDVGEPFQVEIQRDAGVYEDPPDDPLTIKLRVPNVTNDTSLIGIIMIIDPGLPSQEVRFVDPAKLTVTGPTDGYYEVAFSTFETNAAYAYAILNPAAPPPDPAPYVGPPENDGSDPLPAPVVSGAPSGTTAATMATVSISGDHVAFYRYKLGATPLDCSDSSDYEPAAPVASDISVDTTMIGDATIRLCVVAANAYDYWQPFDEAVSASWTVDTTPPDAPVSITAGTSGSPGRARVNMVLAADRSDYASVQVFRDGPSNTNDTSAPSCGSGTLVYDQNSAPIESLAFDDYLGIDGLKYGSYRLCISDAVGNQTSAIVENIASTAWLAPDVQHVVASDVDGDGTANSGSIVGTLTSNPWGGVGALPDFTLANFDDTADSGWNGDGSLGNPYRLTFDGIDDSINIGVNAANTHVFWFRAHTIDSTFRYIYNRNFVSTLDTYLVVRDDKIYASMDSQTIYAGGISANEWVHAAMTCYGGVLYFLVNGELVFERNCSGDRASSNAVFGGSFDGDLAQYRAYSTAVSPEYLRGLYANERSTYVADLPARVDRPSRALIAGGESIQFAGHGLDTVAGVSVGGLNVDRLIYESEHVISVDLPAGLPVGQHDIIVDFDASSTTMARSVTKSATNLSDVTVVLDPANNDGVGGAGSGSNTQWQSQTPKGVFDLRNFAFDSSSGWNGAGSKADPFHLQFDGIDDTVALDKDGSMSYSLWFRADTIDATDRSIFYLNFTSTNDSYVRVRSGNLNAHFQCAGTETTTPVSTGQWYHFAMTLSGGTARYYLNGSEFDSDTGCNTEGIVASFIGSRDGSAQQFHGAIGHFRAQTDLLSAGDILDIYNEQAPRYPGH